MWCGMMVVMAMLSSRSSFFLLDTDTVNDSAFGLFADDEHRLYDNSRQDGSQIRVKSGIISIRHFDGIVNHQNIEYRRQIYYNET